MTDKIILRELNTDDLPLIAAVHSAAFPDGALTRLGRVVVERYYLWQLTGPHSTVRAVGAFSGGDCAGFSFGGVFTGGSTSGFLRLNKTLLVKQFLLHPQNILSPQYLQRVWTSVKILRRAARRTLEIAAENASPNKKSPKKPASFGILSIAVSPEFQSHGIGKMLLLDAEREAVRSGFSQMDLMVHPDNTQAVRFYEKLEWEKLSADGKWRGVMIKKLRPAAKIADSPEMQKATV